MTPLLLCSDSVFIQPGGVSESMKHGPSSSLDNICVGSSLGVLSLEKVIENLILGLKSIFYKILFFVQSFHFTADYLETCNMWIGSLYQ